MRSSTSRRRYQFTERLLLANILEHNTLNGAVSLNLLSTYQSERRHGLSDRYDDRFRQGDQIDPQLFPTVDYERTHRAVFMKFQYLLTALIDTGLLVIDVARPAPHSLPRCLERGEMRDTNRATTHLTRLSCGPQGLGAPGRHRVVNRSD